MFIEFPVLIAVTTEPLPAIVMPFVGKPDRNAVHGKCPELFDQAVVEFASPLTAEKCLDCLPALDELGAISPAAIRRVSQCHTSRIARIPSVFGHANFLSSAVCAEWRQRWSVHEYL